MKFLKSLVFLIGLILIGTISVNAEYMLKKSDIVPNVYVAKIRNDKQIYDYMYITSRKSDNQFVYCLEPGVHIIDDLDYTAITYGLEKHTSLTTEELKKVKKIIYYGYGYVDEKKNIDHTDKKWYAVTQSLLWDIYSNGYDIYFTKYLQGPKVNIFSSEREELNKLVLSHDIVPKFGVVSQTIVAGDVLELKDENNVLDDYNISITNTNVTIDSKTNEKLVLRGTTPGTSTIILSKKSNKYPKPPILYIGENSQTLLAPGSLDPIRITINISVVGGSIKINKVDSESKNSIPQGNGKLAGAKYIIVDHSGHIVETLTTDENGIATSSNNLKINEKYYFKEIEPSEGYKLDNKDYPFTLSKDNINPNYIVEEDIIRGIVTINKKIGTADGKEIESEPNVTFDIFLKTNDIYYSSITTDESGRAIINLPYGTWVFKQRNTNNNFDIVDNFDIEIKDDNEVNKELIDKYKRIKIKLIKKDFDSHKIIRNVDFKFKIKDIIKEEYICHSELDDKCLYKTKDGVLLTSNIFDIGKYQIEEVNEDNGIYEYNSNPLEFIIDYNDDYYLHNYELELDFFNKKINGNLEVLKIGEKYSFINNEISYEELPLDNVEFNLISEEDIYDVDNTILYKKGQIINAYKTKEGLFHIENLPLGKYKLEEISNDNRYITIDPYYFELDSKCINQKVTIKNILKKGILKLIKEDSITSSPIPNTIFDIYLDNNKVLEKATDNNGQIFIKDLPYGSYTIIEKQPNIDYMLNSEEYKIDIKKDENEIIISNDRITVPSTGIDRNLFSKYLPSLNIIFSLGYITYVKKKKI